MSELNRWNLIYSWLDPVALQLGWFSLHWYGIMYVAALLVAFFAALKFAPSFGISKENVESYVFYAEIGVILGARLGYILIYDPHTAYYLTHPWQIFNPVSNGEFVGIRGMSYHGAVVGFVAASLLYCKLKKQQMWRLLDLCALCIPLGYIFGRVGNFLNAELFGRQSDVFWGVFIEGALRHPSQLYEAFFEGVVLFGLIYAWRKKQRFEGELICVYLFFYGVARIFCEAFREPDSQIGFLAFGLSMGQVLSFLMIFAAVVLYAILRQKSPKNAATKGKKTR